jgi:hypothetical protein
LRKVSTATNWSTFPADSIKTQAQRPGGWFSKFIKKFIGTIITVALCLWNPLAAFKWATLAYAAIGSGVSTAVNGGTFASFAIGMGIGLAAAGVKLASNAAAQKNFPTHGDYFQQTVRVCVAV